MKKTASNIRTNVSNSRKTQRKQKRLQKKAHRQEHYMKKKNVDITKQSPGKFVLLPPEDTSNTNTKVKNKKHELTPQDILNKERQKEMKQANKLKSQMEEQRRKILLKANEDEDKVIKKLEKQLGLKKSKNKKSFFSDDGLDYLLEICDRATSAQIVAAEKHLADVEGESDFEEDLAMVMGKEESKKKHKKKESDNEDSEEDLDNSDEEMDLSGSEMDPDEGSSEEDNDDISDFENDSGKSDDDKPVIPTKKTKINNETKKADNAKVQIQGIRNSKVKIIKEDDLSKVFSDDEISHLSGDYDDNDEELSGDESDHEVETKKQEKPDEWEDIYGRKRDKEGNIIKEEKGIYIPPHLRNKDISSDKEQALLQRQIQSVLNKLASTNLQWASTSLEGLYGRYSRHACNAALYRAWVSAVAGPAHSPPRQLADHAALVAVLHANVASEVGAYFLEELAKKFDQLMETPQRIEDKTLDNTVACLAHLYNFKLFQASLLYDILRRLLEGSTEKGIECSVGVLRAAGGMLRKDEPTALKDFIHATQATLANNTAADGSRIKFLMEVLLAVKNNNLTKIPQYDPTHTIFLQKQIRVIIRPGNYCSTLNIRLEDLLKADERGKWWVVGSAWEGNRPEAPTPSVALPPAADQKLLELARKMRMNTDVRKAIFCLLMSAEDYMDAWEKLQQLGLRGRQEAECARVVIACCLQEPHYNPYYGLLADKLSHADRTHQLSIQFTTWDKIKDLENMPKHSTSNLAQLLVHLILNKGLPLSVLKVIEFSNLNKHSVKFMRQILLAIILNKDFEASLEVFHRISKPAKLHMFRESLRLFIRHFLLKNAGKSNILTEADMAMLKERVVEVDKILTMHESKLRL